MNPINCNPQIEYSLSHNKRKKFPTVSTVIRTTFIRHEDLSTIDSLCIWTHDLVHQGEIRLLPVIWQIFIWWELLADWVILGIVICRFMLLGGKHETSAFCTPELTPPLHLHTLSLFCACCHTHPLHTTGWQKSSAFWMGCTFCLNAVLMCHAFVVMLCIPCVSWCSHVWHHFWNSSCLNSILDKYSQVFHSCIEKNGESVSEQWFLDEKRSSDCGQKISLVRTVKATVRIGSLSRAAY